jgi:hypothetical protein
MRIAYIVGTKNCGSTLLDTLIGQAEGVRSLGEIGGLFRYVAGVTCDCGEKPVGCSVCASFMNELDRGGQLEDMQRLFSQVKKERRIFWTFAATNGRRKYAEIADRMFSSIAESTNSTVLVDSTKNIGRAAALAHHSQNDVKFLHLIRDGRGFLVSRKGRSPIEGLRFSAAAAQLEWLLKNLAIWLLLRPKLPEENFLLCRYEDLMIDPQRELERIGIFLDINLEGVADRASHGGVVREHVYEPQRAQDYKLVKFKPSKLGTQKLTAFPNFVYWVAGGFVSKLWRYDYGQSYLGGQVEAGSETKPQ